jgi:soluble lytic murein transglycosylase-like protein
MLVYTAYGTDEHKQQTSQQVYVDSIAYLEDALQRTEQRAEKRTDALLDLIEFVYSQDYNDSVPDQILKELISKAEKYDIPLPIAYRLIHTESRFDVDAVSRVGAVGLAQVLPSTARDINPDVSREDLFDPATNMDIGFQYLNYLVERFRGDYRMALLAYNRGPGRVSQDVSQGVDPANGYATRILK